MWASGASSGGSWAAGLRGLRGLRGLPAGTVGAEEWAGFGPVGDADGVKVASYV